MTIEGLSDGMKSKFAIFTTIDFNLATDHGTETSIDASV